MRNALVVFDDATLGGRLFATPLITALARKIPGRNIGVACSGGTADFMRTNPYGVKVHEFDKGMMFEFEASRRNIAAVQGIIQQGYDTAMVLPTLSCFYAWLLHDMGIGRYSTWIGSGQEMSNVISANAVRFPDFKRTDDPIRLTADSTFDVSFHFPVPSGKDTKYVGDSMLDYLRVIGEEANDPRPEIWTTPKIELQAEKYLAGLGVDKSDFLLGINLRGWAFPWSMDYVGSLAKMFNERLPKVLGGRLLKIFVNVASDQEADFRKFCSIIGNTFPVVSSPLSGDFRLSGQMIRRCQYFVSTQTGSAVMAQARNIDTPSTVIYPDEVWKKGWMCPSSRVIPLISRTENINDVPLEEVYMATKQGIERWSMDATIQP
ncbi:MAG: hypothetical protein WC527_07730 [Candidatus Margulisiibacteriota bacterium]